MLTNKFGDFPTDNMTYREYLIAKIAGGVASNPSLNNLHSEALAVLAISLADAILEQLERGKRNV